MGLLNRSISCGLLLAAALAGLANEYRFDGRISEQVLRSYLSRSMTVLDLATGHGNVEDNIRMLKDCGVKFAGRSIYLWGAEADLPNRLELARKNAVKVHAADPEIVLQACVFEIVSRSVENLPVPDWAFKALGRPVEKRNFRYEGMVYPNGRGRDQWGQGASVPDVSRDETKLWFYYLAVSYLDAGCEAIHFGQAEIMNRNDPDLRHWAQVLDLVRRYAAKHARRHWVLCDAHVPSGGLVREGRLLLDFHAFPLRIAEVVQRPQEGELRVGFIDSIYGRSKGGTSPSGWRCSHLPYLVELDNYGVSDKPGQAGLGGCWVWGYDEITWFAQQPEAYRNEWLRYAWRWVREHDQEGYLEMPGSRCLAGAANGKGWYYANRPSAATPDGFGQEDTIRDIWARDTTRPATAAEPAKPHSGRRRAESIRFVEFEDITPAEGLVLKRARYTYDMYKAYTPEHVLTLNYSTTPSDKAFPGDTMGRYILSATLLSRALHEPEPETLKKVMAALPTMLNAEGYLGWVLPPDRADETGLSNAMWSNGLTEYCLWTQDETALRMNRNLFAQIILPIREAYYYYYSPEKTDGRIRWVHCTGDTAQAFGIIDPATRGYALFPSRALRREINELIRLYQKIDHVEIKAQIHAVLFTTRGILRWYEVEHNPRHLQFAEDLYRRYRQLAMTEDYENYNWFGRPEWTEGCAIVDSFTVAVRLWRLTGKAEYLEDAQHILFNGLLANQKGGDFGVNNCVGPTNQIFLKPGDAAPWCCSVWGGKGLARAIQYSYFQQEDGLMVTIPGNSTVTARLPGGVLTLKQTTGYPHENGIRFEVLASESKKKRTLAVFLPSWIKRDGISVAVNGQSVAWSTQEGFLVLRRAMKGGDVIELGFEQSFGAAPLVRPDRSPGFHRYMHGPLILGADTKEEKKLPLGMPIKALGSARYQAADLTLVPLCELTDRLDPADHARSGAVQLLFRD